MKSSKVNYMKSKRTKRKKTIAEKYPTRQALVYSGAALLIVIVGLRTILSVAEEGFGVVEYMTIFGLGLEFSMLLLYAWTIYSAGKEAFNMAEKEEKTAEIEETKPFEISPKDIPELISKISIFADRSSEIANQLSTSQEAIIQHSKELHNFNEQLNKLLDEQVSLRVRQEIQRLLSQNIGTS